MSTDDGKTHYVGDGCQPAHDPRIDQAPDKIEVPCSGCSTDPCYHWPYCTELLSLRAEVERTERTMKAHREVAVAAIAGTEKQLIEVRAALTTALEQNERFDKRYRDAEADIERLTRADRQWADHVKRLSEEVQRLRDAIEYAVCWVDIFGNTPESGIDHIRRARASDLAN